MIGKIPSFPQAFGMAHFLALVFLANLGLFPQLVSSATSCYSCMTCTSGTETVFTAALGYLGTTNEITDYTEVPTFPVSGQACPIDDSAVQKSPMDIADTPCVSGYWVFKDSDGAVVQSCTAAIPVEDLFVAASETNTAETLKTKMAMLTEAGIKADLTMLTTAEDKKGTASIEAMFTVCTTDDCNTPKANGEAKSTVDLGAFDDTKSTEKLTLFQAICTSMVTNTKGTLGHDCTVDAGTAAGSRVRREATNDQGMIVIIVAPGVGLTAAGMASAYTTALAAVKDTNKDNVDETALLNAFATSATFTVTDNSSDDSDKNFCNPVVFSNIPLVVSFILKALL